MKCIGCGTPLGTTARLTPPAAYAIMAAEDIKALGAGARPDVKGPGAFHAMAVCDLCWRDPAHRKRKLKAHFLLPPQVNAMSLAMAGSSSRIGG